MENILIFSHITKNENNFQFPLWKRFFLFHAPNLFLMHTFGLFVYKTLISCKRFFMSWRNIFTSNFTNKNKWKLVKHEEEKNKKQMKKCIKVKHLPTLFCCCICNGFIFAEIYLFFSIFKASLFALTNVLSFVNSPPTATPTNHRYPATFLYPSFDSLNWQTSRIIFILNIFYRLHFALFDCIIHKFKRILNFCCHNAALLPVTLWRQPNELEWSLEISIKNEWLHFANFTQLVWEQFLLISRSFKHSSDRKFKTNRREMNEFTSSLAYLFVQHRHIRKFSVSQLTSGISLLLSVCATQCVDVQSLMVSTK